MIRRYSHRLLFLLVLVAIPTSVKAQDWDWAWADGQTVQAVTFEGLKLLNAGAGQAMISTRPGKTFDSDVLAKDIARLYRSGRFGSPNAGVAPVNVKVVQSDVGSVRVEFTVHERPKVRAVLFEGSYATALSESDLNEMVKSEAGGRFATFTVELDVRAILKKLRDEGYLLAEVSHREAVRESGVDVHFVIRPGPAVYVDEVIYDGALQLDPSVIADAEGPDALETKERAVFGFLEEGVYKREAFKRDLERISRYYRSQGFLDARIYKKDERFSLDGEALTLVVGVEEGQRYTIRRVSVEGTKVVDGDRLLSKLALKPGRPFLGEDLRKSIDAIRHVYGQRAYVHSVVDVDVRYDIERHMLDLILRVNEGPKVRIEKIRVEGNEKTLEKVVRRELTFYPGEYFNADEVEASLNRLGRLRFFNDVRVDFSPGPEPGREDVILRVDEARTGSFVLGGGISTSAGFFGNISLTQRNFDVTDVPSSWRDFVDGRAFTGAGQSLSISVQPGRDRSQYSVTFEEPWFLDFPVLLGLEGAVRERQREDWLERRRVGRISLGYRLTPDLVFRTSYRIERVRVTDVESDAPPDAFDVEGTNYVGGLRFSLSYNQNRVDRDFVVYGGYSLSLYYEIVAKALGGDFDFQRAGFEGNWQTTLLRWPRHHKWVFQIRNEIGWQKEIGSGDIPIFERFFAGGPNSIRGFRFRSVGPKFDTDKPIGGNLQLLGTAEFSFPLFQDLLRGVLFLDAGTVVDNYVPGPDPRFGSALGDFFKDEMRVTAGFGVRIKVPFFPAPVALDFGWPLQKKRDDETQVFSFSVGFGF
jgi:outer membrane protein insertion porin family